MQQIETMFKEICGCTDNSLGIKHSQAARLQYVKEHPEFNDLTNIYLSKYPEDKHTLKIAVATLFGEGINLYHTLKQD